MTKKLLLPILMVCLSQAYAQVDLKKGLVLHLPFTGNTADSSGFNRHGFNNHAVLSTDRCGNTNSAYWFNGINSSIEVPTAGLINLYYTYSIWVYATEIPENGAYKYPLSIGGSGGGQNIALCNNAMQGWAAGSNNGGNPALSLVAMGTQPNLREWYHVVLVRDTTKIRLYVNGQLNTNESYYQGFNTSNGGNGPNYGSNTKALIGSRDKNANFYFSGLIDDVRIYNRVLSVKEVDALYHEKTCFFTSITTTDANKDFTVYPNPASTQLNLDIINAGDASAYCIINPIGQTVLSGKIDNTETTISLQLPVLPAGVYTVCVSTSNGNINKRVVIVP